MKISFFGSSLVSAYWNGAATYYRGILRALAQHGHEIVFYEPDAFDRQQHRDMPDPPWAQVRVYEPNEEAVREALAEARGSDIIVKASGVGVFDEFLEAAVLDYRQPGTMAIFWDVDAPATLERMAADPDDPFRDCVPEYDLVFTYGGGPPVAAAYRGFGARSCISIYNAVDLDTHHPVPPDPRFAVDLALMANRMPDREDRVREFMFKAAELSPDQRFLLAGNGWEGESMPANMRSLGHVYTRDHNAFNSTPRAVLNVSRDSMARYGYSPATRVFEAAAAGACIITDAWEGVEQFFEPGEEWLVAGSGEEVAALLSELSPERAGEIGEAARRRVQRDHTYEQRATDVLAALERLGVWTLQS